MISPEESARFLAARDSVCRLGERERHGIGMQQEKTVHAVVKAYEDPDEDHHEIPIGPFIADIYREDEIIEVQTASFQNLREKLNLFLETYAVKVVHPIPAEKWVVWVDPETGRLGARHRSPKRGTFYHAFEELYRIRDYLSHPGLCVELLLIDMEEYRLQDGWGRGGKRGSHRYDRLPLALRDACLLTDVRDYLQFLPPDLPPAFTSKDLAEAAHIHRDVAGMTLHFLLEIGIVERIGKKGRAFLYEIRE